MANLWDGTDHLYPQSLPAQSGALHRKVEDERCVHFWVKIVHFFLDRFRGATGLIAAGSIAALTSCKFRTMEDTIKTWSLKYSANGILEAL